MNYRNNPNPILDFLTQGLYENQDRTLGYFPKSRTAVAIPGLGSPKDKNSKKTYIYRLRPDGCVGEKLCLGKFANCLDEEEKKALALVMDKIFLGV